MDDYERACREHQKMIVNVRKSKFVMFAKSDTVEIIVKEALVEQYKYVYGEITPILARLNSRDEVNEALEFTEDWVNFEVIESSNNYKFSFIINGKVKNVEATYIIKFKDGSEIFNDLILSDSQLFYIDKNKVYSLF